MNCPTFRNQMSPCHELLLGLKKERSHLSSCGFNPSEKYLSNWIICLNNGWKQRIFKTTSWLWMSLENWDVLLPKQWQTRKYSFPNSTWAQFAGKSLGVFLSNNNNNNNRGHGKSPTQTMLYFYGFPPSKLRLPWIHQVWYPKIDQWTLGTIT